MVVRFTPTGLNQGALSYYHSPRATLERSPRATIRSGVSVSVYRGAGRSMARNACFSDGEIRPTNVFVLCSAFIMESLVKLHLGRKPCHGVNTPWLTRLAGLDFS